MSGYANNKGAGQPAHPRRLISAFVILLWKVSYKNLLQANNHFSRFVGNPEDRFCRVEDQLVFRFIELSVDGIFVVISLPLLTMGTRDFRKSEVCIKRF